jgi:prepilin-type N-terminal cleavage/methylation domain-containing protein
MKKSPRTSSRSRGFSLIELMIALVAGLIVSYAVVAFTMSSLKNNGEYVQSTRLTQALRDTMDFTTRELRRAGYDENALAYLGAGASSPFSPMLVTNPNTTASCVIYAYDRPNGDIGQIDYDNGEVRGLRRVTQTVNGRTVGVIEYAISVAGVRPSCAFDSSAHYASNPSTCTDTSEWCALTDPTTLNITEFRLVDNWTQVGGADPLRVQLRDIGVTIKARRAGDNGTTYLGVDNSFQRGMTSSIKVRSECQMASIANCNALPSGS